jgi:hypothetical protein
MVAEDGRVLRGFLVLVQFSEPSLPACLGLAIFVGLAVVFGKLERKVPAIESFSSLFSIQAASVSGRDLRKKKYFQQIRRNSITGRHFSGK